MRKIFSNFVCFSESPNFSEFVLQNDLHTNWFFFHCLGKFIYYKVSKGEYAIHIMMCSWKQMILYEPDFDTWDHKDKNETFVGYDQRPPSQKKST